MSFTADSNGIYRYSPTPTGDAGDAIDANAGVISAAITTLTAAIASANTVLTALTSAVSGKAAKAPSPTAGHAANLDGSGNPVDSGIVLGTAATHAATDFDASGSASTAQAAAEANAAATYFPLTGGTISGDLNVGGSNLVCNNLLAGYARMTGFFADTIQTPGGAGLDTSKLLNLSNVFTVDGSGNLSLGGTLTFPDATTQSTAWTGSAPAPSLSSVLTAGNDAGSQLISGLTSLQMTPGGSLSFASGGYVGDAGGGGINWQNGGGIDSTGNMTLTGSLTLASLRFDGAGSLTIVDSSNVTYMTFVGATNGIVLSQNLDMGSVHSIINIASSYLQISDGFSGSGSYTNFTIVNGIITSAS